MEVNEENASNTSLPTVSGKNTAHFWKEFAKLVLFALIVIVPVRFYMIQPFIVDGASMDPTFGDGDYLLVDELSYQFRQPERGEVLIFKYPKDPCQSWVKQILNFERSQCRYFIKRVIGLPQETISIKNGAVTVVNAQHPEGFALVEPYVVLKKDDDTSFTLGDEEYFVMGDNRLQSADSRLWGAVPQKNVVGRPLIRLNPPSLFPGAMAYEEDNAN